jgi:hypothetical protein
MKAISVQQPYADWIVDGKKAVENRTWPCDYRGLLLIHASKSKMRARAMGDPDMRHRTYGAIIGQVNMFDCLHMSLLMRELSRGVTPHVTWITATHHKHIEGPFCWCFATARRFRQAVPYRGRLGIFDVPDDMLTPEVMNSDLPLFM